MKSFRLWAYSPRLIGDRRRKLHVDRLPDNPLEQMEPAPIEVFIPATRKDYDVLPFVLESLKLGISNPIERVVICSPEPLDSSVRGQEFDFPLSCIQDCDLLSRDSLLRIETASRARASVSGSGWMVQQALKFSYAMGSSASGVLILDADTLLFGRRNFLSSSGSQLLSPSYEYHRPYERNFKAVFKADSDPIGLSFVTHHQLFQPRILREMFLTEKSIVDWLSPTNKRSPQSPVSEYHTYGRFITQFEGANYRFGAFKNSLMPRSEFEPKDLRKFNALSVSLHSYLQS